MKVRGFNIRSSHVIRKDSSHFRWINQSKDCSKCQFKVDGKKCVHNGVLRNIYTKGGIHKTKCKLKDEYRDIYIGMSKNVLWLDIFSSLISFEDDNLINVIRFKYDEDKKIIHGISRFKHSYFYINTEFLKFELEMI